MKLSSYTIKQRIATLTVAAALSFIAFLAINLSSVTENAERLDRVQSKLYPAANLATKNMGLLLQLEQTIQSAVTMGDEEAMGVSNSMVMEINANLGKIGNLLPEEESDAESLSKALNDYHLEAQSLVKAFLADDADMSEIKAQADDHAKSYQRLTKKLTDKQNQLSQEFEKSLSQNIENSSQATNIMMLIGILATIFLSFAGFKVNWSIINAINNVTESLKSISEGEGDLRSRINYSGKDEISTLVHHFNQFVTKLQSSIANTKETTVKLSETSASLLESSENSSQASAEQHDAINKISHGMEELRISVANIAENAGRAALEAEQANTEAKAGQDVVSEAVTQINQLSEDVKKAGIIVNQFEGFTSNVNDILGTIRGIAEQTNLLALNAAIEAARAGEQGRGFAVVADEVRSLASRTQTSTQEIQQVLQELKVTSTQAVEAMQRGIDTAEQGVRSTSLAGDTLISIANKVDAITCVNDEIASATSQQQSTSETIYQSVESILSNAEMVSKGNEALSDICKNIDSVSQSLDAITNQFKV